MHQQMKLASKPQFQFKPRMREDLNKSGCIRIFKSFNMWNFFYSETAAYEGTTSVLDDFDVAVKSCPEIAHLD